MEENRSQEVKIDKTAPEVRISFDPKTQKLDIQGIDATSGGVSVAMTSPTVVIPAIESESGKSGHRILGWLRNITKHWIPDQVRDDREKKIQTIATLTDEAGHKTELVFEKKKDKDRRIDLVLVSVSYDGVKTTLTDARMQYRWLLDWRKREYRIFASYMRSGDSKLESHYIHRLDETWIMERARELGDDDGDDDADRRSKRMKLPGMVVPYLETAEGSFGVKYPVE